MEPLPRETLVDALELRLRDDILSGRYPIGALLPPERELAAGYQVTRTTLKHALVRLAHAGLLETRHGVGSRVRDFTQVGGLDLLPELVRHDPTWLTEVFHIRRMLGKAIAGCAAAHATPTQQTKLAHGLAALATAPSADAAQEAEAEIHRTLAQATGNRLYVLLTHALLNAQLPVRHLLTGPFTDPRTAAERLAPLIQAVQARETDAAEAAAQTYLLDTETLMARDLAHAQLQQATTTNR